MSIFLSSSGKTRNNSPIPLIPELKDIKEIDSIHTILRIRDFVFSTVPWFMTPSKLSLDPVDVVSLYKLFIAKEAGGWCGLNADYFQNLVYWYQIKTLPYNFGIKSYDISHVGVVVDYDGEEFFMDPYFASHYIHRDGFLLTFKHLIALISERHLDHIVKVYSDLKKPVQQEDGTFIEMTPQEIHKSVITAWTEGIKIGTSGYRYEEIMKEVFGQIDPLLLMLIKIVG